MNTIAIVCDAGEAIGFGHWSRCQAIADELNREQHECTLFLRYVGECSITLSASSTLYDWGEPELLQKIADNFDTILIDSYRTDALFYARCAELFHHTFVLDDFNRITYPVDHLINPNPYGPSLDYSNQTGTIHTGAQWVILRPPVLQAHHTFTIRPTLSHITISLGGSDYRHLVPKLLAPLLQTGLTISVMAATTAYSQELISRFDSPNLKIYDFLDAHQTVALIHTSDLFISGGGQTLHELACIGVPTLAITIDDDQIPNIHYYQQNGFLIESLQWDDITLTEKMLASIERSTHQHYRRQHAVIGTDLIDGLGCKRIANLLKGSL